MFKRKSQTQTRSGEYVFFLKKVLLWNREKIKQTYLGQFPSQNPKPCISWKENFSLCHTPSRLLYGHSSPFSLLVAAISLPIFNCVAALCFSLSSLSLSQLIGLWTDFIPILFSLPPLFGSVIELTSAHV